jgi:putative FmdB family regulatory protein
MPLYEYQCEACGKRFEVIRKVADSTLDACTLCGQGPVTRLLSSPAIQFKGTGWYITDYSQKGRAPADKSDTGGEKKDKSESPASTSESAASKTESKPPSPKGASEPSGTVSSNR